MLSVMFKEKIMKILEMPPYYLPEQISSTHLTSDLTEGFVNQDWTVVNIVPTPCRGISEETRKEYSKILYEELYNGKVQIYRFPLWKEGRNPLGRALRYFLSNIIQAHKASKIRDVDIVLGGSTPPIQGLLCGYVAKKLSKKKGSKIPFLYMLQDVFPDSLVTTGLAKKNGIIWKIGRVVENKIYKNADKIIVIGDGIKGNIVRKGVSENKVIVVSNWIDLDKVTAIPKNENRLYSEYDLDPDKFTVCYAGNLGAAQGTEIIFEAAKLLSEKTDIQFIVFGRGRDYETLKNYIDKSNILNVKLYPILPQDRVSEVYSLGDVNLITCKSGVGQTALPSKLWSILACNRRIVASYDVDSDLAGIIVDNEFGLCVEPGNPEKLAEAIYSEYCKGKTVTNSREYVYKHASKQECVNEYINEIRMLVNG